MDDPVIRLPGKRFLLICMSVILLAAGYAGAETINQGSLREILNYIDQNQPELLELQNLALNPKALTTISEHMPEESVLHFTTTWDGIQISDTVEELDMTTIRWRPSLADMERLIRLLPNLRKVDISGGHRMYNDDMIRLTEEFPQVEFIWRIELSSKRSLCTTDTAYSTFNVPPKSQRLTDKAMELLQYAPNLKALDLGHNQIVSLDFLRFFPDLELLILADNPITDIEMVGTLKHLKYLEIFNTRVTDLSPLENCTELLDLNVSNCPRIKDLSPLSGLTSLERFWGIQMRGLSEEQKEQFIKDHPLTQIMFDAEHPTAGGWREHKRYSHYTECLKNHQWIPFAHEEQPEE